MERGAARWRLHGGAHAQGGEAPGARHQTRNIRGSSRNQGRGTRGSASAGAAAWAGHAARPCAHALDDRYTIRHWLWTDALWTGRTTDRYTSRTGYDRYTTRRLLAGMLAPEARRMAAAAAATAASIIRKQAHGYNLSGPGGMLVTTWIGWIWGPSVLSRSCACNVGVYSHP
jgi:hypothetical protein